MDSSSISIRHAAKERGMEGDNLDLLDQTGEGDARVRLWLTPWGQRVIETNGDPIWEHDAASMLEACDQLGLVLP